jgi:prolyl-tRNA synthetase
MGTIVWDLPLLINQWANVVRWEMRTRLFLRTAEFYMQKGIRHMLPRNEAIEESERMMNVYAEFAENFMAIPIVSNGNRAICQTEEIMH